MIQLQDWASQYRTQVEKQPFARAARSLLMAGDLDASGQWSGRLKAVPLFLETEELEVERRLDAEASARRWTKLRRVKPALMNCTVPALTFSPRPNATNHTTKEINQLWQNSPN